MALPKILIVDDQAFARQLLHDELLAAGMLVAEAADGAAACALAATFQPDLIMMDMVMPGLDGIEACRRLKADPQTASIPVIVLTANKEKNKLVDAFAAGADDYLNKPFASHELLARINSNLAKRSSTEMLRQEVTDTGILLEISQAITSSLDTRRILQIIVEKIAGNMDVLRCSIVRLSEGDDYGYVLASSDDPGINGLRITLDRYPEIREVIRTGKSLVLEDVKNHPLMREVREHISGLAFSSILVLPVIYRNEVIGTLMLRTARAGNSFSSRELRFCELVANVSASALKNAYLYEKARGESQELREVKERLERELREKALFEFLFEHASDGLMALNARGELVYVNRSALAMLGYSRNEVLDLGLADIVADECRQDALENHLSFFVGREYRRRCDLVFLTKGEEKLHVSMSVSDYRLDGRYLICSFTDVTEERRFQKQLQDANERLRSLDRLKSEFIRTATHELRIPVSIMYSYCALLGESDAGTLTETQRQYLKAAVESGERLVDLIDSMLDLARIESGGPTLNLGEKKIIEPIRDVYSVLAPYAEQNGLHISIEPIDEELSACFDPAQIACVLTNLIGNAIKFTPPGGGIGISAGRHGEHVRVTVSDTGVGIPEECHSKIFDEFCQVGATSGPRKGSGLGLTICKRIIAAHKGDLWVDSAPQKGSIFTFTLPSCPSS
ncbi:hybrid sensor histidine kinase/response regulator [Geomobilimonas luticola]|uniref:histidine kinase n=1 Tax=Geomobilimonas luticola TaxID=1114878 RepID=A0ABS5SE68_9BACT|nr:response regulator [Geomobilimonas luticola]MBT0653658.1 response regulator [Geomobilimonas luticola]